MKTAIYSKHFGLRRGLLDGPRSDVGRLPLSEQRMAIVSELSSASSAADAVVVLCGAVGVGKTLLASRALSELPDPACPLHLAVHPSNPTQLLDLLLIELDAYDPSTDLAGKIAHWKQQIEKSRSSAGIRCVMVENAHVYSPETLQALEEITHAGACNADGLRVVLMGTAQLAETLDATGLERLRQRIRLETTVPPMASKELGRLLKASARRAGSRRKHSIFGPGSLEIIHSYAGGIPRVAETLCDSALSLAASREEKTLSALTVRDCAATMHRLRSIDESANARPMPLPASTAKADERTSVEVALGIDNGPLVPTLTDIVGIDAASIDAPAEHQVHCAPAHA